MGNPMTPRPMKATLLDIPDPPETVNCRKRSGRAARLEGIELREPLVARLRAEAEPYAKARDLGIVHADHDPAMLDSDHALVLRGEGANLGRGEHLRVRPVHDHQ